MTKTQKIVAAMLVLAMFLCLAAVWPIGLLRQDFKVSSGDTESYGKSTYLQNGSVATQEFIAQQSYLKEISFSFHKDEEVPQNTTVHFRLEDQNGKVLVGQDYDADALNDSLYCTVEVNKWLKKGGPYRYVVEIEAASENTLTLFYTPSEVNWTAGNSILTVNGEVIAGQAYNLYLYTMPVAKKGVLSAWLFITMIGMSLLVMIGAGELLSCKYWNRILTTFGGKLNKKV